MKRFARVFALVSLFVVVHAMRAQCPAVGSVTGCSAVITITNKGASVSITGQGPYDGDDDMLIGIVNKSSLPIVALELRSGMRIFDFDGDGLVNYGVAGNGRDTTGYGGPNAYFTAIDFTKRTGTVNFVNAIRPIDGTAFFALENAVNSAVSCSSIINKSVLTQTNGPNIRATFIPKQGYTLAEAAQICGFTDFNWVQLVTHQADPSKFIARNIGGAFDPSVVGEVRLTSARTPFNDPPPGGGYTPNHGGGMPGAPPDFSYPFYYNLVTELPGMKVSPTTLGFYDKPSDRCLPGGADVNTPDCLGTMEPAGSYGGYTTHLAGVTSIGGAVDLNVGFVWRSNYNGTTGGVNVRKTLIPDTPLDGTGEATITSTDDITDYDYNGLEVTAVNGQPVTALDIPVMPPWALAALAATLFAIALVVLRTR